MKKVVILNLAFARAAIGLLSGRRVSGAISVAGPQAKAASGRPWARAPGAPTRRRSWSGGNLARTLSRRQSDLRSARLE